MKAKTVSNKRKNIFFALAIVVLVTWLCYLPSCKNQFVNWDDCQYVYENADIDLSQPGNFDKLLSSVYASNYHPVTMLSLAFDFLFSGYTPHAYHVTNLILHLLNTVLVFLLLLAIGRKIKLSRAVWIAFIAALLFGIHPLHVESVAWISERKDLLYTFFYLLSLLCYIRYLKGQRQVLFFLLSVLAFAFSLLSKAQAAPLAVSLLLLDYLFGRSLRSGRVILEKIPFFVLAVFLGVVALHSQKTNFELAGKYTFFQHILFAGYGYSSYLLKTIVPLRLSAFYPYPGKISAIYYLAFLPVIATVAALWIFRKKKIPVFCILFFIVNILLVIQLLPVGKAIMADRYFYVPSIGLFFLIAWGISILTNERNKYAIGVVFPVYALLLCILTTSRVKVWKDPVSLWENVLSYNDKISLAWYNLGHYRHYKKGDFKNAYIDYNKAIEYGAGAKLNDVYNNRGDLRMTMGDVDGGIADFNKAISIDPDYAQAYYNRGNAWMRKDSLLRAIDDYNRAAGIDKTLYPAMNNRGHAYSFLGKYDKALESFNQAIASNPHEDEPKAFSYFGVGNVYFKERNYREALVNINRGLVILPGDKQALALKTAVAESLKQEEKK